MVIDTLDFFCSEDFFQAGVTQIQLEKACPCVEVFFLAAGEVIHHYDAVASSNQGIDNVGADEARLHL